MKVDATNKIVNKLINKLEDDYMEILNYRPSLNIYELKNEVYNINYYKRGFYINFDIIFDTGDHLPFIYMTKLEVVPQGRGTGTLLMESFLERVSEIEVFERIYLKSINEKTDRFWGKLGFSFLDRDCPKGDLSNSSNHPIHRNQISKPNMVYFIA